MEYIEGRPPKSVMEAIACLLLAPAICWIFAVVWLFEGRQGCRTMHDWMFAKRLYMPRRKR
jgi:hypothetical protein